MPPKAKITREMIVEAAFETARTEGADSINARTVSQRLDCSTQPVMYHFATIEELKRAAYQRADRFHAEYLMSVPPQENVMLGLGLNYIRFAVREPRLFRFLFQSGHVVENSLPEMIDSPELKPVLSVMGEQMGLEEEKVREVFWTLALFVHGYASLLANNSLEFDETEAAARLKRVFRGAMLEIKENGK